MPKVGTPANVEGKGIFRLWILSNSSAKLLLLSSTTCTDFVRSIVLSPGEIGYDLLEKLVLRYIIISRRFSNFRKTKKKTRIIIFIYGFRDNRFKIVLLIYMRLFSKLFVY